MPKELETIIRQQIRHDGPLSVEAYWNLCLAHPQYGYYITRDPLGVAGDFTTAPEISQLFGEMIGIWLVDIWERMGNPPRFHLVECGPGRGTLMADLLRIGKLVPDFMDAIRIHLVETSPALREKQKEAIPRMKVTWHDSLDTVPQDESPVFIIGNEFLDALPIQQFIYQDNRWYERVVGLDANENLSWGLRPAPALKEITLPENGKIFELSLSRETTVSQICKRIRAQGGAALMIDYGHEVMGFGDTFQAVKNHKYVGVLDECGEADLTSHVDFARLKDIAIRKNLSVHIQGQGDFLISMGIQQRAAQLMEKSDTIQDGLHRLIHPDEMGTLFKVMEIVG